MVSETPLTFERLLSDISSRFANIPPDRLDEEITWALKQLLEFFQVDRCGLVQILSETSFMVTHMAEAEFETTAVRSPALRVEYPVSIRSWANDTLIRKREVVSFSRLDDLPVEALADKQNYVDWGVRSTLNIPIVMDGPVSHIFVLNSVTRERDWPEECISRLKLLGEIFVNALARGAADLALRESEERLSLAMEAAGANLWSLSPGTGAVYASAKTRELYHIALDEELNYESFIEKIHPDDRDRANEAVRLALLHGDRMQSDHRIILSDGNIRWIRSLGRLYAKETKELNRFIGVSFDISAHKLTLAVVAGLGHGFRYAHSLLPW
ncbi:MAG: PAS domain-containing protein [Desulfobacterales bacterium]|jgi:PAS domain S-box-containing protein|nr:PAS domain-containing protein [Desulfobacterales bacterium]